MKKSRFFLAAGALVLAATAVFAGKANRKFNGFTTAVVPGITSFDVVVPSGLLTTSQTSNSNYRVFVTVSDGTARSLNGDLKSTAGNPIFYIQ